MSQSEPRPVPLILSLDQIDPSHLSCVGPKAFNLARMAAVGFPVPPGFCLTTHALPEILSKDGWEWISKLEQMETADATQQLLNSVRGRLTHFWLDPALQSDLQKHLAALGPGLVAVRSSATAEDLPDCSSAGQYESILDVEGLDACIDAISRCWASLWTDRAYAYLKANGIDHTTARMAVIVQKMIAAEVSGIVFTADPVSGNRDHLVIEAAPGPGEAIVQGKVVPDRIIVDKKSGDIVHQVLASGRTQCCLATEFIRELTVLSAKVEDLFGCPQDIEWSKASGRIWLLQARPITALPDTKKADWDAHQIWSNVNAGEVMPDVATPMTASVLDDALCDLFGQFFGMLGLEMDPMTLAGRVAGRYYFNVNAVAAVIRSFPGNKDRRGLTFVFGGHEEDIEKYGVADIDLSYLPPARLRWGRALWGVLRFLPALGPGIQGRARRRLNFIDRKFKAIRDAYRPDMTESELGSLFTGTVRDALNIGDMSPLMALTMVYAATIFALCRRWLGDENQTIANQLMAGVGGLEDAQSGFDLWDLAKRAANDHELLGITQSDRTFDAKRMAMASFESGREFLSAWDRFMDRHGHLCRGEIELANPRWAERPDFVLEMLGSYLPDPEAVNPYKRQEAAARKREELHGKCRKRLGFVKRWIFSWVVHRAQFGSRIRENVKNRFILAVAVMRRVLLELGERLTTRGVLSCRDDIFFVQKDELQPMIDAKIDTHEIRRRIRSRRREYDFNCSLNPPPIVVGRYDPAKHVHSQPDPSTRNLNGLAVSPGVVIGPARVILHASDDFVRPGEILVAPFTDPGWTPYFVNAAGIIMDQGGLLSHGSIVAREFGIPCVVNVGPATRIIQTGRIIRVDGNTGTVWLVE